MQRSLLTFGKSVLVAGGAAACLSLMIKGQLSQESASRQLVAALREVLGWPVDIAQLGAALVGQEAAFRRAHDYLLGPALVATSAVVLALKLGLAGLIPIGGRSTIDRLWPTAPDILDPELERPTPEISDPRAPGRPFLAREDEMRALMSFAGAASGEQPVWTTLEGREGVGKTRAALEWLKRLQKLGWDVGLLRTDADALQIQRAAFRRKTAIVVDDAGRLVGGRLWPTLLALLRAKQRLRVLLVDQPVPDPPDDLDAADRELLRTTRRPALRLDGQ
jgi:hypothetical protein